MIDINKQYHTRDGREVRIYATDGARGKVHGAILTNEGWEHRTWNSSGVIVLCQEHDSDLIEVRPRHKRTVWLNVYQSGVVPEACSSKERADLAAACGRIACIKVDLDFEEGEGL